MEEFKNLIVNNKAVAGILSQISHTNIKLSNNIEDKSNYHSYFLPQNLIRNIEKPIFCLLYTSPSPRDATLSRMPSSA